ncbi:CU044_5270 family protein [Virgisporangium aurantiacum]|uniref:CU044_5270 family protein n=1 Tax=Virgisporangium aurantiacum TaxID=175570 RepID=A0A8J4E672_9ACTN|nr:CU044_5270 family protein [Virgisporangium aurantiacum]GIJ63760.1 hypothetical protein Vau01_112760 [Virgisporangium aurantiacum]
MNRSPNRSDADVREELARLVPGTVERDLPSDRHHQLQEFVMSEIHRDRRTTRARPPVRRPVLVTAALTAAAAIAAVVGVTATGGSGDSPPPPRQTTATLSGPDLLLAAATTAQQQPDGTGTYWYIKTVTTDGTRWEYWFDRDGKAWYRTPKFGDRPVASPNNAGFTVGAHNVSLQQIQNLPTSPDALKAWVTTAVENSGIRNSGGPLDADGRAEHVFYGLISLVSQLPAPPKVRAAAFQAIAAYPNVTNLGPVDGGTGLRITLFDDLQVQLVIDPATTRVHRSTFVVLPEGGLYMAGEGGSIALTTEWTDTLPQ